MSGYRHKPSASFLQLKEALRSTTLFLVARHGPTVFSVKDEAGVYRVGLGPLHSCSCSSPPQAELCLHQLFCLLKVLKVPEAHPLAFQLGYTDNETDQGSIYTNKF